MRRILLLLFVLSAPAVLKAQEMTGDKAQKVKEQIIKMEEEKASIIVKGGSAAADYYDRWNDEDEAYLNSNLGTRTKAEVLADWRLGVPKIISTRHYDFRVRVYDNGNTAVVTYRSTGTMQRKENPPADYDEKAMEVFVKQNGKWRVVAHGAVSLKKTL